MHIFVNNCDICFDKTNGCTENGNCTTCKNKCHRFLRPTIRITTKCTQSCSHCCFSCSPEKDDFMSIETAKEIGIFIQKNYIKSINVMGGEIWLNPSYKEIIEIILEHVDSCRIVTNGDFAIMDPEFLIFLKKFKNKIILAISKDKWHTNINVEKASHLCELYDIKYVISEGISDKAIVPIGKSIFSLSSYSLLNRYCGNPDHRYTFLINELGNIFKCTFEIFKLGHVSEFQDRILFAERFKTFNKAFRSSYILTCSSCIRIHNKLKKKSQI